jgi:hypothetical protein
VGIPSLDISTSLPYALRFYIWSTESPLAPWLASSKHAILSAISSAFSSSLKAKEPAQKFETKNSQNLDHILLTVQPT